MPEPLRQALAGSKPRNKAIETIKNTFKYSINVFVSIKENSYRNI
jgi:hypothetical protein